MQGFLPQLRRYDPFAAGVIFCLIALSLVIAPGTLGAVPLDPEWKLMRPGNTGIPGESVQVVRFAPDGKLWVGARWPFWSEGGVGIYDRNTQIWNVLNNWQTPLPSEYVNDIEFAAGGVVWIATDQGLVKKDGESWTVFDSFNSPLFHDVVRSIDLDSDGHVWMNNTRVTGGLAGIFEFDGVSWRSFAVPTELPWEDPWRSLGGLVVDRDDHVWVSHDNLTGVAEFDGSSWTLHGDGVAVFSGMAQDLFGNIWLLTAADLGYAFFKFDGTVFTSYSWVNTPFAQTSITRLSVDDTGAIFVGNWMGQVIKSTDAGATWSSFTTVTSFVTSIAHDPLTSDVWIGSQGAVHHHDASGTRIKALNSYNTGMPHYFVDYMSNDRSGFFWVATGEGGLSRFDGERWRNWGNHNAGSEPYPFAGNEQMGGAYEDRNGMIWMGGNGIARWDPATGEFTGFWNWENNPGMGTELFPFFAEDAAGQLFAVTDDGYVFRFDGSLWVFDPVEVHTATDIAGMLADSQGNVWIAAWAVLHKWDGASWTRVGDSWPLFDMGGINVFTIAPNDDIWMGTNQGLLRWDGAGLTVIDTANSPLPSQEVRGIDFRDDGLIGLSTSDFGPHTPFPNGVALIEGDISNPANWSVFHYEDSPLPHYQLGRVAFDSRGDLWVNAVSEGAAVLLVGGVVTAVDEPQTPRARTGPSLLAPVPNPFNPRTTIRYELPSAELVEITLFNLMGRKLRTLVQRPMPAGRNSVAWDGRDDSGREVASGVYLMQLRAGGRVASGKLTLMR